MDLTTSPQQNYNKFSTNETQNMLNESDLLESLIDLSSVHISDEETWLYSTEANNGGDAIKKLYSLGKSQNQSPESPSQRSIDTRTFTRPKKRITRPSVEKYNQDLYGTGDPLELSTDSLKKSLDSGIVVDVSEPITPTTPLHFDLAQPSSSYYFENVLAKATDGDSFQNMSPPSLVNSMCSSTFANLMDSSFIKNDPVLREISHKDYTDSILLQDCEPPLFQSISESFSSVNSDSPESFLKKVVLNHTRDLTKELDSSKGKNSEACVSNSTFDKIVQINPEETHPEPKCNTTTNYDSEGSLAGDPPTVYNENYGATYRRPPRKSHTFRKSDLKSDTLNATFRMSPADAVLDDAPSVVHQQRNTTLTLKNSGPYICGDETVTKESSEMLKNQLRHINDLNKLSYCVDRTQRLSPYKGDVVDDVTLKRNSIGSADSLDRMSSLSNCSSRGSNKMLNMADVDAIVEMQEKSLQQVMSTPKPNTGGKKLWEHNFISPIVANVHYSDSDTSSTEEYRSVKSSASKISLETDRSKPPKLSNLDKKPRTMLMGGTYKKPAPRSIPTSGNLQAGGLKSSQPNIRAPVMPPSNLKTMGTGLKGSYTNLRPISTYLPVAPPPLNQTVTQSSAEVNKTQTLTDDRPQMVHVPTANNARVAQVQPMIRAPVADASLKPRMSGLPRPISGLPRPVSRIPGPKRVPSRPTTSRY
ncbi:uncharacterized protein LOC109602289 isoform X2 [Aethina tumida]|uniref:uncharacterized protein LOC109602289 isoform X2 n=1 Tax=Aethina tumida TaxID=116153 RepID=UPI002148A475|nr:uncharacterized protein LOC109602289 isoform X2 [Aethina tumida]